MHIVFLQCLKSAQGSATQCASLRKGCAYMELMLALFKVAAASAASMLALVTSPGRSGCGDPAVEPGRLCTILRAAPCACASIKSWHMHGRLMVTGQKRPIASESTPQVDHSAGPINWAWLSLSLRTRLNQFHGARRLGKQCGKTWMHLLMLPCRNTAVYQPPCNWPRQ